MTLNHHRSHAPKFSYAVVFELILCMVLINFFFLFWGLLQEDLTTKPVMLNDGTVAEFSGYLVLNTLQSMCCILFGFVALGGKWCLRRCGWFTGEADGVTKAKGSEKAIESLGAASKPPEGLKVFETLRRPRTVMHLLLIGFTQSIGPTFGMFAAEYVSYPTVLVAKTIKMIPVMLVGYFLHRVQYPRRKVLVAFLITVGVLGFSMHSIKSKRVAAVESASVLHTGLSDGLASAASVLVYGRTIGFVLLIGDLFFSAYTASTQDAILKVMHYTSMPLMIWTNASALCWQGLMILTSEYPTTLLPSGLALWWTQHVPPQASPVVHLCQASNSLLYTIALYTLCGSGGQMIVFYIIARFGSVTLTATTVTRKVFGIVLSIVWNQHQLHPTQWLSLGPILAGVALDFTLHGQKKQKPGPHHAVQSHSRSHTAVLAALERSEKNKKKI